MPPSAGACQTTEAAEKPDWGRAGDRSSIITAITWREAMFGGTRTPVSGAGTRFGVGATIGAGEAGEPGGPLAGAEGAGATDGAAEGPTDGGAEGDAAPE